MSSKHRFIDNIPTRSSIQSENHRQVLNEPIYDPLIKRDLAKSIPSTPYNSVESFQTLPTSIQPLQDHNSMNYHVLVDHGVPKDKVWVPKADENTEPKVDPESKVDTKPTSKSGVDAEPTTKSGADTKPLTSYAGQIFIGSLTIVGLFILFRMIQKSK